MSRRPVWCALAASCALTLIAFASPLQAQEPVGPARTMPSALRGGRWAMDFVLAPNTEGAGVWRTQSRRNAIGLDISGSFRLDETTLETPDTVIENAQARVSVVLEPAYRRYLGARGPVASFAEIGALVTLDGFAMDDGTEDDTDWRTAFGGSVGFGLQWFVTDQFAMATEIGVRASYSIDDDEEDLTEVRNRSLFVGVNQPLVRFSILF